MRVFINRYIPFGKRYHACNLFGVIFAKGDCDARMLRHEYIHTLQMKELLYVGFYLIYILEWVVRLVQERDAYKAYRRISFEREAYEFESRIDYHKERKCFAWRKFI